MEITSIDFDDDLFFSGREDRIVGQWNGRYVEQWGASSSKPQVSLCMSCSRNLSQLDGEFDVYRKPDGEMGGKVSLKAYFDPNRTEGRDNESAKSPEQSTPEVDSRDRDFDR